MAGVDLTRQPAQQTSLGLSAMGFLPNFTSPEVGLVLRAPIYNQNKNYARILYNLRWSGTAWTTDKTGYTLHRAANFNSGASFKEFGVHWDKNGASRFIQQVGKQVQLYNPLGDPLVEVPTTLFTATLETIPCMRSFSKSQFLYVNGIDQPQIWDPFGTPNPWRAQTNWPVLVGSDVYQKPKIVEIFQNRAVYAGFDESPYSFMLSTFGNPEDFNFIGTGTSDPSRAGSYNLPAYLGPITSLKTHRVSALSNDQVLIIGCQKGLAFLSGTTANDFTLVIATDRFGIVSNRAWFKLDDMLIGLCTDGIRAFQANTTFSSLINAAMTYPIHSLVTNVNPTYAQNAFVIDNPNELEACFYYPSGGQVNNTSGIRLNYADMASGITRLSQIMFPPEMSDLSTRYAPACGISYIGTCYAGGTTGLLQKLWNGNKYNNVGIQWRYGSPMLDSANPSTEAGARSFTILCEGADQYFTASAFAHTAQANDGNLKRTFMFSKIFQSAAVAATTLGSWVLGSAAFPISRYQSFTLQPRGGGRGWEIELSGNTANGGINFIGIFSNLIGGGTRQ